MKCSSSCEKGRLLSQEETPKMKKKILKIVIHLMFIFAAVLNLILYVKRVGDIFNITKVIVISTILLALCLVDWKIQREITNETTPIKVYEQGISPPITTFDWFVGKKDFIPFTDIGKISILQGRAFVEKEAAKDIKSKIKKFINPKIKKSINLIILTNNGKKYKFSERHPTSLHPIIKTIKERFKGPICEEWKNENL